MAHALHHAESSARRFGGEPSAYIAIHDWLDASKIATADRRHRAARHHAFGAYEAERVFGMAVDNGAGARVPVRQIVEQHIREDLGRVPSLEDWVRHIPLQDWMMGCAIDAGADGACDDRSVERWRAEVAEGRTILGWLDWIRGAAAAPVRPFLDLSTGHLSQATRALLEATTPDHLCPSMLMSGPYGWLVHVPEAPGPARWPDDLEAVLAYARDRGCDYVLLDRDAAAIDALPWFEDGDATDQADAGAA